MSHRLIIRSSLMAPVTEDEHTQEPGTVKVWEVAAAACILSFLFGLAVGM